MYLNYNRHLKIINSKDLFTGNVYYEIFIHLITVPHCVQIAVAKYIRHRKGDEIIQNVH